MTFVIKHKRSDRPVVAEYRCPTHGLFSLEVARDGQGNPPAEMPCPRQGMEFANPADAAHFDAHAKCGIASPFCISAPGYTGVRRVEAVKGGWEKPARKTFLDTRDLGEGQDIDDWRAHREAIRDEERRKKLKELIDDAPF